MLRAGERARISATIQNPLLPGRYFIQSWVSRNRTQGDIALHALRLLDFVLFGTRRGAGSVEVRVEGSAARERECSGRERDRAGGSRRGAARRPRDRPRWAAAGAARSTCWC